MSLVQNDKQKADYICGKFKQELVVSFVNYTDYYSENTGVVRI